MSMLTVSVIEALGHKFFKNLIIRDKKIQNTLGLLKLAIRIWKFLIFMQIQIYYYRI
jgi:hypothetical protein